MFLLAVALDVLQASLCVVTSVIYSFQDFLPRAAVRLLNDTQVPCFSNLGQFLVLEVDRTIAVGVEHQHLGSTDA